jgi:serine/threonine protein kinase
MTIHETPKIIDHQLVDKGRAIDVGGYKISREISRGANGIVYEANDPLLKRRVAIKLWTKLKADDKRNKVRQGILEARKAYQAKRSHVVEIYHAGIASNFAFVVMEYVKGISLRKYLSQDLVPLGPRVPFAYGLLDVCNKLHRDKIYHGDLHANNILLIEDDGEYHKLYDPYLHAGNFKIIDFGTSQFTGHRFSRRRHFQLIIETINELFHPLSIFELYGYAFPKGGWWGIESWDQISKWLYRYIGFLRGSLVELGYGQVENYIYDDYDDTERVVEFWCDDTWDVELSTRFVEDMRHFVERNPLLKKSIEAPHKTNRDEYVRKHQELLRYLSKKR